VQFHGGKETIGSETNNLRRNPDSITLAKLSGINTAKQDRPLGRASETRGAAGAKASIHAPLLGRQMLVKREKCPHPPPLP